MKLQNISSKDRRAIPATLQIETKGEGPLLVQNGAFFLPNGKHVASPPAWAAAHVAGLAPGMLDNLGFMLKSGKLVSKSTPDNDEDDD